MSFFSKTGGSKQLNVDPRIPRSVEISDDVESVSSVPHVDLGLSHPSRIEQ